MKVLEYGNSSSELVLIQMTGKHEQDLLEQESLLIREQSGKDFRMVALEVDDWNRDLSPWEAPAVFGKEMFGGGAADTLSEVLKICDGKAGHYYIGGYSLAGLFALWASCQTDLFEGVAAASPSIWFPDFIGYMKTHEIRCDHVYLSLGNKEEKTRNPMMASVGKKILEADAYLKEQKKDCVLEWNQGNHFTDPDIRTAKAFAWLLGRRP